eukprot:m.417778 g.417778  ORF g.417778 m.417778 type:complete len:613 (-) comp16834_c0_seq42:205-2043(-)
MAALVVTFMGASVFSKTPTHRAALAQSMDLTWGPSTYRETRGQPGALNITLDMYTTNGQTTPYPLMVNGLPEIMVQMWNESAGTCTPFSSYEYAHLKHTETWDSTTMTNSLQYGWGGFTVQHTRSGPLSIDMEIILTNDPQNKSAANLLVPLCGISLLVFALPLNTSNHRVGGGFGPCPGTWNDGCYPGSCPIDYPQAICMDWGNASAAWVQTSDANSTGFELSSDSCPTPGQAFYRPKLIQAAGRRIELGDNVTLDFSLRFGEGWNTVPTGRSGSLELVRADLEDFGKSHPFRNIDLHGGSMAALFGSDTIEGASAICNSSSAADCPNPRGWNFLGCQGKKDQRPCNTTTPEGIANFQAKARTYFQGAVIRCLKPELKCRAIMAWSIEGSEWADITYSGSPDMLPVLAPEMDTIADELFAMITSAGIRAGVTLRPQIITPNPNWNSSCPPNRPPWPYYQKKLLLPNEQPDEDAIFANLQRKANYAIKRWSISVFYVDSTGFPLVSVWDRLRTVFPDVVFIPEQSGPLDYASVTPLQNDWNGVPIGVNEYTKVIWPTAYNYQLMQVNVNVTRYPVSDWAVLAKEGDVFRVDGWYDSAHNKFIEEVLAAADEL